MADRPNILMILVDQMRADALGCFGNEIIKTPNLDRLAERGTRFAQCMVTQPTCTPCRASLLSGCFPSALRSRMVGCVTPDDSRLLPRVLAEAGFHTAAIGKIHFVPQSAELDAVEATRRADGSYDYYGFQHVDLVNGDGMPSFGQRYTPWVRERVPDLDERRKQRESLCGIPSCWRWPFPPEVHPSQYIADRSVEYLQQAPNHGGPFFLYCSFPDPHHPFTVPEPYASMYHPEAMPVPLAPISECVDPPQAGVDAYEGKTSALRGPGGRPAERILGTPPLPFYTFTEWDYRVARAITAGMITLLDDGIGRVLGALQRSGLADNTVVIFASDHGDYLGDYGLHGKGLHYDCVLRTPLLLRAPGIPVANCVDQISSLVDVAPTLLELIGIAEPDGLQGISMMSGLNDPAVWPRDGALTENDDDVAALRLRTLTTVNWKLTIYAGDSYGELYDRNNDPNEQVNLWNDSAHAATKARLLQQLADHMLCASDGANGRVQQPAPRIKKHIPRKGGDRE